MANFTKILDQLCEAKFKIGDKVRHKSTGKEYEVTELFTRDITCIVKDKLGEREVETSQLEKM